MYRGGVRDRTELHGYISSQAEPPERSEPAWSRSESNGVEQSHTYAAISSHAWDHKKPCGTAYIHAEPCGAKQNCAVMQCLMEWRC